jgi:hypothetical protein
VLQHDQQLASGQADDLFLYYEMMTDPQFQLAVLDIGRSNRWTYLSVVIDRESAEEFSVLVAGHFKHALVLEQEELRGAQTRSCGRKSGATQGEFGRER